MSMYERKHFPLAPRRVFYRRLARNFLIAQLIVVFSLAVGMAGYCYFESMGWADAFVNASMILSGMGPMGELKTTGGKIFAGCYALYSGLALILIIGIILGPVVHRALHKFHLEDEHRDSSAIDSSGTFPPHPKRVEQLRNKPRV